MFKHLFVIDPLDKLNLALDSSLQIAREFLKSGDQVSYCEMTTFEWESGSLVATAECHELVIGSGETITPTKKASRNKLSDFDLIHMRKDPPFDIDYVAATWFLDTCLPKTKVLNLPTALRSINEKLVTLNFPDDIVPTLVSSNENAILDFFKSKASRDMIIKPFDMFGGHGIVRLDGTQLQDSEVLVELGKLTEGGKKLRIAQPFQPAIFNGEVRCFVFGPEPIAWTLKRPAAGSFMANTRLGATLEKYTPTSVEIERASRVGGELAKLGIWMIGFDMIGGRITEINVTSPRLLSAPEDMASDHAKLARTIRKWMMS